MKILAGFEIAEFEGTLTFPFDAQKLALLFDYVIQLCALMYRVYWRPGTGSWRDAGENEMTACHVTTSWGPV